MDVFNELDDGEKEILLNAPYLVMILIAGADGTIDKNEISKAISATEANANSTKAYLNGYYKQVAEDFTVKFHNLLNSLPAVTQQRNGVIVEQLSRLNSIFSKTDKTFSIVLYTSLRKLAVEIAKASGGVLGINSISEEEMEFLDLPMIKDPSLMYS